MTAPQFLSSPVGRLLRVLIGSVLIAIGLWIVQGTVGVVLVIVGIAPLLAGLLDICLIGALFFGTSLRGEEIRHLSR